MSRIYKICKIVRIYEQDLRAGFTRLSRLSGFMSRICKMRGVAVGAQGALDIHEQGILNYGGPKLWKRSGSGDPDL